MNDNEIIELLDNCCNSTHCYGCQFEEERGCASHVAQIALDLINRQKAEIERLKIECLTCDAEKVVRCENCKYWVALNDAGYHWCQKADMTFYPHEIDIQKHYCSLAERKRGDSNA